MLNRVVEAALETDSRCVIVGVSGKKRSGKDSFYLALKRWCSVRMPVERMAFADALRDEAAAAISQVPPTNFTKEEVVARMTSDEHKERYRLLLQWWGTEYRRCEFGSEYWVESLRMRLAEKINLIQPGSTPTLFVITDVRFQNEAEAIKTWGGSLVRVVRTEPRSVLGVPRIPSLLPGKREHPSETALDNYRGWNVVIKASNLTELDARVYTFAKEAGLI